MVSVGILSGKVVLLMATGEKGVTGVVGDNVAADEEVVEPRDRAEDAVDGDGLEIDDIGLPKSATATLVVIVGGADGLSSICLISFESVSSVEGVVGFPGPGDNIIFLIESS